VIGGEDDDEDEEEEEEEEEMFSTWREREGSRETMWGMSSKRR